MQLSLLNLCALLLSVPCPERRTPFCSTLLYCVQFCCILLNLPILSFSAVLHGIDGHCLIHREKVDEAEQDIASLFRTNERFGQKGEEGRQLIKRIEWTC